MNASMGAVREMVIKCPNCGAENPDYGFYCGKCAHELPRALGASRHEPQPLSRPNTQGIWDSKAPQPDALVAIAINVRRVVVLMMLGVFLTLGGVLVSWWSSYFWTTGNMNPSDVRAVVATWGAISAIVIAFGLYYVVYRKRITQL